MFNCDYSLVNEGAGEWLRKLFGLRKNMLGRG